MRYTQAQLLSLSGMTVERLRHWRKAIPSLDAGAGRGGALSFEDVALVTALSHAMDVLGITLGVFAPHYDAMLQAIRACPDDRRMELEFWMDGRAVVLGRESKPPPDEALALVRIGPALERLLDRLRGTDDRQLAFALDGGQDRGRSMPDGLPVEAPAKGRSLRRLQNRRVRRA